MNDDNTNLELTPEEQAALERDEGMIQALQRFNEASKTSFEELFPNAKRISDMLFWSLDDSPVARARIKQAIANGADVNEKGENDYTPLHGAAENNLVENVKLLLLNGAEPNASTRNGKTPLDFAQYNGHNEVVALLKAQMHNNA